jgi:opacity protein-like surface antigen
MKKILLLFAFALFILASPVMAEDIYVGQSAAGGVNQYHHATHGSAFMEMEHSR